MATYFVYRCDEMGPAGLHRRRFDDASLLDWFRNHWRPIAYSDEALQYADTVLGVPLPDFAFLFDHVHESGSPPPTTIEDVRPALDALACRAIIWEEHCVQLRAGGHRDPDVVCYFFDEAFVAAHPELTAYLLHDGPLPDGAGEPGWTPTAVDYRLFEGEGHIHVLPQIRQDSWLYRDLSVGNLGLIEAMRLPQLCRRLMTLPDDHFRTWLSVFSELRELLLRDALTADDHERAFVQALQADPGDEVTWLAFADWLMERGEPSPGARLLRLALAGLIGPEGGDPDRTIVRAGEHVAQVSINAGGEKQFDQLILFDDLWGAAHPVLANSLLRYGSRWDILSTGNERRSE